jgi:hypothetical protein
MGASGKRASHTTVPLGVIAGHGSLLIFLTGLAQVGALICTGRLTTVLHVTVYRGSRRHKAFSTAATNALLLTRHLLLCGMISYL